MRIPLFQYGLSVALLCCLTFTSPASGTELRTASFAQDERPLFANEEARNWSARIDAPGRPSDLLTVGETSAIPRGVKIAFKFLKGGNYIGIKRAVDLGGNAKALSFSARSDTSVKGVVILEGNDGQFHQAAFQLPSGAEHRIHLPLGKDGFPKFWGGKNNGAIQLPIRRITVGATPELGDSGNIEFYDFAFVTVDPAKSEDCIVQLEPSKSDNVFFPDEAKVIFAHVRNQTEKVEKANLLVELVSDNGKTISFTQPIELLPYEQKDVPVELPIPGPSFSELTATVKSSAAKAHTARASIAVVRRPALQEVPFRDSFFGTSFGDNPETMRRIGVRFIREIVHWKYTNPAAGVYAFEQKAEWGRRCREAGIGTIFTFAIWQRPDWVGASDPGVLKDEGPFENWKLWINAGLRRLLVDSKSQAVEIGNEPDLEFSESVLVRGKDRVNLIARLIRTGYDLTRSYSPDIPVLGAGCSGGGPASLNLVKNILSLADHKIDFVSIHPYPAGAQLMKADGSWMWPDKYLAETVSPYALVVSQFTNGKKIWCTELGWAYPSTASPIGSSAMDYASVCAQTLVIHKSMDHVGKIAWFIGTGLEPTQYGASSHPEAGYSYNFFKRSGFGKFEPTTAVSAFSTVSSLLEGAQSVGKLDLGSAMQCYLFDNPSTDQSVAILWATKRPVLMNKADPETSVSVLDCFGREVEKQTLRITRSPIFIIARHGEAKRLEKLIQSSELVPEEPISIEQVSSGESNRIILEAMFHGTASVDAEISAGDTTKTVQLTPGKNLIPFTLPNERFMGDRLTVPISVETKKSPPKTVTFEKRLLRVPYIAPESLSINNELTPTDKKLLTGKLISRSDVLPMDPNVGWNGVDDLSVRYGFAWNEQGLYLVAVVRDDQHVPVSAGHDDFYNYDSLQLVIDPLCDSVDALKAGDREIGLALDASNKSQVYQTFPITSNHPKYQCAVFRQDQQTVYKLQLPQPLMGTRAFSDGSLLALNFIVNDNDGGGRTYWMGLSDGIATGKRPSLYPWLYLMPK